MQQTLALPIQYAQPTIDQDDDNVKPWDIYVEPQTFPMRPYQIKLNEDTMAAFEYGYQAVLDVSATGSGKTVCMMDMVKRARVNNLTVGILVHLDPLVPQTFKKLLQSGFNRDDIGFIKAGWPENPSAPIQVMSIQTMKSRRQSYWDIPFQVLVIDESHELCFFEEFSVVKSRHSKALRLGYTATPFRLKTDEALGDHFDFLVNGPLPSELMDQGYLIRPQYYQLNPLDLEGVKLTNGDYNINQLSVVCNNPAQIMAMYNEWTRLCPGRRTIAFCVDVDHAENTAQTFQQGGVPSEVVTGSTTSRERNRIYKALGAGELLMVSNCNVLSTGFDEPSAEVALLMRPTKSRALHFQQMGRVLRLSEATGKTTAWILDQAGNLLRPGLGKAEDLCADDMTLEHAIKTGGGGGHSQNKTCPKELGGCGRVINLFFRECPHCDHSFRNEDTDIVAQQSELIAMPALRPELTLQRESFKEWIYRCYQNKWNPQLAMAEFQQHYLEVPCIEVTLNALYNDPSPGAYTAYFDHLLQIAVRDNLDSGWLVKFMTLEFGGVWRELVPNPAQILMAAKEQRGGMRQYLRSA